MIIKNRITLGIIGEGEGAQLVAQVDALSGIKGGIMEHVKPWLVLDIPLPVPGHENDPGQFAVAIGEVVTAHLLAEVEADEPEKKGPVRLSDAQAEAELRALGHPIELMDLVGLPGFGDKRATDLMAKWLNGGRLEADFGGGAVFIDR